MLQPTILVHALIEAPHRILLISDVAYFREPVSNWACLAMVGKIDWESQIGRRLKLRDLHVFGTVVQRGSMAKAAAHLKVSQPAVSEIISDLEHALGVRLLDRGPQGVEPTMYGRALLKGGTAAFDESSSWPTRRPGSSGSAAHNRLRRRSFRR